MTVHAIVDVSGSQSHRMQQRPQSPGGAGSTQDTPVNAARDAMATPAERATGTRQNTLEADLPRLRIQLLRHARHAVHDAALAEDLVQDTLIAVLQQHQTRRGEATLRTWSTSVLKHKVADWYRSPDRRRLTQFDDDSHALSDDVGGQFDDTGRYREPVAAWQQPDGQVERKQMMQVLDRCMTCLPPQTKRVFMMREWLGFDTGEICERLGVSADNCRVILHRARTSLRGCMERDWFGRRS